MSSVRALLARVKRLDTERMNPVLAKLGGQDGWAAFQAEAKAGIEEGRNDRKDMEIVLRGVAAWLN